MHFLPFSLSGLCNSSDCETGPGSLRQSNRGGVYRYRCRFYQTRSPSDSQTVRQGGCTGVAVAAAPRDAALSVCLLLLHRIPIAMKLSAEQYKLCALLVRAARQCAAHFAAGACLCTACTACNICTICNICNSCSACALLALLVYSTGYCL